jgi:hypothetical protein
VSIRSDINKLKDEIGTADGACPGAYEQYPDGGVWYIREGQPIPEVPLCLLCGQRHMKPEHREPHVVLEVVVHSREEAQRWQEQSSDGLRAVETGDRPA